jgi:general secretion pathway protein C
MATTSTALPLLHSVRVVPEQVDGKVIGLRLFGIRPSSLLGTLGLRNGDRLESINGFPLGDPEKALEAYARLRTAPHLRLSLQRAGRPLEVDLNII